MEKYRILMHGENLAAEVDGVPTRMGFYTTVFVEAFSRADAEARATDLLRSDPDLLNVMMNKEDDPLVLSLDEINEVESFDGVQLPRTAFAMYSETAE
jgi:hypothetical protein